MELKEMFYPESQFGGYTDIDGTIAFFNRINSLLIREGTVLDVGCGRGAYKEDPILIRRERRIIQGKVRRVIGIDVDKAAEENPYIDEFRLFSGHNWPVDQDSVDLIICDNVLEHIEDPEMFFDEARRALRNGGYLCIRTPNAWSYVAILARVIPNKHHATVTRLVQKGRKEEDVFPTLYRCNSIAKLGRMMRNHGFRFAVYGYEAEPSYLSFSKIAYWLGVVHQRFAPGFLRSAIFAFGQLEKDAIPG